MGIYRQIDLDSVWGDDEILGSLSGELSSCGFELLGDLMNSAQAQVLLRGFALPAEGIYATILIVFREGKYIVVGISFYSLFPEGISLTTTTIQDDNRVAVQGILYEVYGWQGISALHDHHKRRLIELRPELGEPPTVVADLPSLARSWDSHLVRYHSRGGD